tara:strand:- start:141 stop:344 length:204 start_codon:yes stop_codon:yes gene_type:complete
LAEKYNKKYILINIMLKAHIAKLIKKMKDANNKKYSKKEEEKIKKAINRRHRSQSPLHLDNILIKIN